MQFTLLPQQFDYILLPAIRLPVPHHHPHTTHHHHHHHSTLQLGERQNDQWQGKRGKAKEHTIVAQAYHSAQFCPAIHTLHTLHTLTCKNQDVRKCMMGDACLEQRPVHSLHSNG